jgi:hypothetical protein
MANRPMDLSAPPGPKVRSGVKAPVSAPASSAEHRTAYRRNDDDDDDDLVVEGAPEEGAKVRSDLAVSSLYLDLSSHVLLSPPGPAPALGQTRVTRSRSTSCSSALMSSPASIPSPPNSIKTRRERESGSSTSVRKSINVHICCTNLDTHHRLGAPTSFGPAPSLSSTPVTSTSA